MISQSSLASFAKAEKESRARNNKKHPFIYLFLSFGHTNA
ncbi:hypothetical protein HMPREF3150_03388 [Pseudomonas aeruginosa]|nr:hypothetical protein HMPREF3150_03388 [Pseudomonas aeruginosa]